MHPFTSSGAASGRSGSAIENALAAVEHERERREQYVAEREHELLALNSLPVEGGFKTLPPPPTRDEVRAQRERATR